MIDLTGGAPELVAPGRQRRTFRLRLDGRFRSFGMIQAVAIGALPVVLAITLHEGGAWLCGEAFR